MTSCRKRARKSPRVRVLSAYKQGFLWLTEVVIPDLKGKGAKSIAIKVATNTPDLTKNYRFYEVPSRWVHELYPADEFFERQLAIPKANFGMELVDEAKEIYSLEATNATGQVVYRNTFSPKIVEREYLEKFPGWSRVKVTTGWLSATVDGQTAIDARIATDPERFWDIWQGKTLPKIYDNVMKITGNRPTAGQAAVPPRSRHRSVDERARFPNRIDEEQVSSLESLHEDLYFVHARLLQRHRAEHTGNPRLAAPGKVFPIIHPSREARRPRRGSCTPATPRRARGSISVTRKRKRRNRRASAASSDASTRRRRWSCERWSTANASAEIELQTEPKDDREAIRAADALDNLVRLHAAGLYKTELSYDHVDRIARHGRG